jgi:putative phosphoribosyl transferase
MIDMADLKRFKNRLYAGELLAERLSQYVKRHDVVVIALSAGGVPTGYSVAKALEVPLDIMVVRKLGVPGHDAYAIGSIVDGGLCVLQHEILEVLEIPTPVVEAMAQLAMQEIEHREKLYRSVRSHIQLQKRTVIIVDDGMNTGSSMLVAVKAVRKLNPARIVIATPVSESDTYQKIRAEVDEAICIMMPDPFYAVGLWYEDFEKITDVEVMHYLEDAEHFRQQHIKATHQAIPMVGPMSAKSIYQSIYRGLHQRF